MNRAKVSNLQIDNAANDTGTLIRKINSRHHWWDAISLIILAVICLGFAGIVATPFVLLWQGKYLWALATILLLISGAAGLCWWAWKLLNTSYVGDE